MVAAADLVAHRGFHAVTVAEIGAAAGITGSGVYRHFEGKSAVLVALFDRIIDDLLRDEAEILASGTDLSAALDRLIAGQVEFVVGDRELAQVYYSEINNPPDDDRRRLRRKQRLYLEEWVHLISELRGDLSDADARPSCMLWSVRSNHRYSTTRAWRRTGCASCSPRPRARFWAPATSA